MKLFTRFMTTVATCLFGMCMIYLFGDIAVAFGIGFVVGLLVYMAVEFLDFLLETWKEERQGEEEKKHA